MKLVTVSHQRVIEQEAEVYSRKCHGSNARSDAKMYNPYVAARDKMILRKILSPKMVPASISPWFSTFSIPFTARKTKLYEYPYFNKYSVRLTGSENHVNCKKCKPNHTECVAPFGPGIHQHIGLCEEDENYPAGRLPRDKRKHRSRKAT